MQIRKQLTQIAAGLRRKELAGSLLLAGLLFALAFCGASLLGLPVREGSIALFGGAVLACSLDIAVLGIIRALFKPRNLNKMAAIVEEKRPDFMDSFATAVQLEALERPLRPIEEELMQDVQAKLAKEETRLASFFPGCHAISSLWRIALAAICIVIGTKTPAWRDFHQAFLAWLHGEYGIVIYAPEPEVPVHSDYILDSIAIKRGPEKGNIIWNGNTAPLNKDGNGKFFFTFYDVTEDFEFRIETPRLRSKLYKVKVYEPPSCSALKIVAQPPAYSGLPKIELKEAGKVQLLEGGTLAVSIQASTHIQGSLHLPGNEALPMDVAEGEWRGTRQCTVMESGICRIELKDKQGHSRELPFELEITKDLPPEITMLEPGSDAFVKPGQELRISANVADNFGLVSLKLEYSVSGGEHKMLELPAPQGKREWDVSTLWKLKELKLKEGDILACQLLAEDNKEPKHNVARSALFFITVRPDQDKAAAEGQDGNQQKEVSVSDLVAEAKRLLRLTWDLLPSGKDNEIQQLSQHLATLENETKSRQEQLTAMAGGNLGQMGQLFEQAIAALHTASFMTGQKLLEESVPYQEKALASLVAIDTELLRNSMKSKNSKSQDKNSEGQSEPQQQQEQPGEDNAGQDLKTIQNAIEEIKRLQLQQGDLNVAMRGEKPAHFALAGKQRKLTQAANAVKQQIFPVKDALPAANLLNMAEGNMRDAENALGAAKCDVGGHYGDRALQHLQNARQFLEALLKQSASQQMRALTQKAEELAKRQEQAAIQTRGGKEDSKQLRQQQQNIQESTSQMMQDLKSLANEMQNLAPEAGKELNQVAAKASSGGLEETQKRAQRALAYKRLNRAANEQQKAAQMLKEMAQGMKDAAKAMNSLQEQELRQALLQLARLAVDANATQFENDQGKAKQRLQQIRQQASQITGKIGEASNSEELQRTSGELSKPTGDDVNGGKMTREQIMSATRVIIQMLDGIQAQKQIPLPRTYVAPPEKYRRQVENYFKDISKE
ncbi:MAG: hypothetical protein IJS08_11480 [Victivallales bacterium]|nr:hypothetical protein [Victivallales bacterium]